MEKKDEVKFTVRINSTSARKLASIAEYYGRSQNGQIDWLIKRCIISFERKHGPIEIQQEEDAP